MHRETWNDRVVIQILTSPVHAGLVSYRGQTYPGAHDGVVDEATYQAFLRERARRAAGRDGKRRYLLSGIAHCAACGSPMTGFTITHHPRSRAPWSAYRCTSLGKGPHSGKGPWSLTLHVVEAAVVEWLRSIAHDVEGAARAVAEAADAGATRRLEAQRLAREVASLDAQLTRLTEQLAADVVPISAYAAARDSILRKRAALAERLDEAEQIAAVTGAEEPSQAASSLLAEWGTLGVDEARSVLRQLIARVDVDCAAKSARVVPLWSN